ncbi:MAG: NAD(P)-dependent oxidoreductase [Bacteroidetes bacterium]|nr:NAD(P)-dependent oxidoreductase [Bacteroidota bacterium]
MKRKIFITGINGFLGTYLAKTYDKGKYILYGSHYNQGEKKPKNLLHYNFLDVSDKKNVCAELDEKNPDIVIHTAGISNVDLSEKNPSLCYNITVGGTKNIADWCKLNHKQLVYCSSNAIFSGDGAPYGETSLPYPVNIYGMHKYIAESIASTVNSHLIFRIILMYGWNYNTRMNPVTYIIKSLREGKKLSMVENSSYINPLYINSCCDGIWQAIALKKDREIYHLAGKDRCDRYNLALTTAEVFGLDRSLISPVPDNYFSSLAKRPYDTSYATAKAEKELGFKLLTLKEGLSLMKQEEKK